LSADRVRGIIDGLISEGVAYVVGLYSYLCSSETYSIISTLEPAFGRAVAEKVSSEITEAFKGISLYTTVKIGDSKVYLIDYLRKYILNQHAHQGLLEEIRKRFNSMSDDERRGLSIASAIINAVKDYEG
jgi:hypothetical protein